MSIEQQAMESPDPVRVLEPENADHPAKELWVVVNVTEEPDQWTNLVNCAVVCWGLDEALKVAESKAKNLLAVCNEDRVYKGKKPLEFDEAWSKVDHMDGIEHEYGYDPDISHAVSYAAIRVVKASVGADR